MRAMSQKRILLSISILVSNRPDTVVKCLSSLDSLRRKVLSELILVDTGCGEQVRKIIEPYADKVVEFQWCNDFARARNAGLEWARGQWFLYLDDDEWFENTDELEAFFLSGRHLQYNYASYLVRNYFDLEGQRYRDEYVGRMVRLEPDTKFVNAIHEHFSRTREPWIRLHSYVHHYGYAFRDEQEARRHGQRNIALLLTEHEREPENLRPIAHLVQEYNALKEWEKSIEISLVGIQKPGCGTSTEQFLGGLYVNVVRNYVTLEQYRDAIRIGEQYLEQDHTNELDRAVVCYNLSIAYLETGEYAKSLDRALRYLDFYEKWKKDRDATAFYEYLAVAFMSEECKQASLCIAVQDGIRSGNVSAAKKYFEEIDWSRIHTMLETQGVQGMVQVLVLQNFCADEENGEAGASADYAGMLKVLLEDTLLREMATAEVYSSFLREPISFFMRAKAAGLWELVRKGYVDIGQMVASIPLYRWEKAAEKLLEILEWEDIQELQEHMQEILDVDSFYRLYWSIPYRMRRIRLMMEEEDGVWIKEGNLAEVIVQELLVYAAENKKLCRRLYREELFYRTPELLPRECQVSLKLIDMAGSVEKDDFQQALSSAKEALDIMPELSDALKCCNRWISAKLESRNREQESARDEMESLAGAVKGQVRNMIARGMLAEALGTLRQLKTLMPEDAEAEMLEQTILQMKM